MRGIKETKIVDQKERSGQLYLKAAKKSSEVKGNQK